MSDGKLPSRERTREILDQPRWTFADEARQILAAYADGRLVAPGTLQTPQEVAATRDTSDHDVLRMRWEAGANLAHVTQYDHGLMLGDGTIRIARPEAAAAPQSPPPQDYSADNPMRISLPPADPPRESSRHAAWRHERERAVHLMDAGMIGPTVPPEPPYSDQPQSSLHELSEYARQREDERLRRMHGDPEPDFESMRHLTGMPGTMVSGRIADHSEALRLLIDAMERLYREKRVPAPRDWHRVDAQVDSLTESLNEAHIRIEALEKRVKDAPGSLLRRIEDLEDSVEALEHPPEKREGGPG